MTTEDFSDLPENLAEIIEDFAMLPKQEQLNLLLEFSQNLPELPERYRDRPELFERVEECQSPVFVFTELSADKSVRIFATAPAESPTSRGFASVLIAGLDGESAETVLSIVNDLPYRMNIVDTVSPLRVRGMLGMLGRVQRQVQDALLNSADSRSSA